MNFINVFNSLQQTGGASFQVETGELNPQTGYMVSLVGYEKVLDKVPANLNEFTEVIKAYFTREVWDKINESPFIYLGLWTNEGKLYIDLSEKIDHFMVALQVAQERKQLAIFDLRRKDSLYLKDATEWFENYVKKVSDDPDIETDKKY